VLTKRFGKLVQIAVVTAALSGFHANAAMHNHDLPLDLIEDGPTVTESTLGMVGWAFSWVWDNVAYGLGLLTPPSPDSVTRSLTEDEKSELFRLLDLAGYKLKVIESELGLIPYLSFKFGMVRELSEADLEFLDFELARSKVLRPDWVARFQRGIVGTVIAVNSRDDGYIVSELKVQVLPLPKLSFDVTPSVTALNEQASALMFAIQRLERYVRTSGSESAQTGN